jgi:hypothetical protein
MLRQDYIMKMIEDFVRSLAKVVLSRQTQNYAEASGELDNLSRLVSGLGLEHLKSLGAKGIVYVFGMNKESETEKIFCSAKIMKEDGNMLEAEGKTENSLKSFRVAKELFEMVSVREFPEKDEALQELEFLKNKLELQIK